LHDLVPPLVSTYGQAAATIGADWYDDLRDEKGIRRRFTALVADLGDLKANSLVGWAASKATDTAAMGTLIQGGVSTRVLSYSRQTIMGSAVADPSASGWQRDTAGGCCDFCTMLESRGAVYSEASVDFASHDHCNCTASPAFEGEPKPVQAYSPSGRVQSDADKARARAWMRANL
jgi:hypothetical protein